MEDILHRSTTTFIKLKKAKKFSTLTRREKLKIVGKNAEIEETTQEISNEAENEEEVEVKKLMKS